MGIVNVSPESFSGDGLGDVDAAVEQALRFVEEGADILDVGGQSTRPRYSAAVEGGRLEGPRSPHPNPLPEGEGTPVGGYDELSVDEEIGRVVPVIRAIKGKD